MTMATIVEFEAYVEALKRHDWHFEFSDDPSIYRAGVAKERELKQQADKDPVLAQAFKAYSDLNHGQGSWTYRTMNCNDTIEALRRLVKREQVAA
jgi:hypothetical protein